MRENRAGTLALERLRAWGGADAQEVLALLDAATEVCEALISEHVNGEPAPHSVYVNLALRKWRELAETRKEHAPEEPWWDLTMRRWRIACSCLTVIARETQVEAIQGWGEHYAEATK